MKQTTREILTDLWHEFIALFGFGISLMVALLILELVFRGFEYITHSPLPRWLYDFAHAADIVVLIGFIFWITLMHLTQLGTYLKEKWSCLMNYFKKITEEQKLKDSITTDRTPYSLPPTHKGPNDET